MSQLLLIVLTGYVGVIALLYLAQRQIVFPAPQGPAAIPAGFIAAPLSTEDGLRLKAAWKAPEPGMPTVLFFHGNGDSLPGAAEATRLLAQHGYGLLLADYRGYADNPGSPSEAGLLADALAAQDFLTAKGIPQEQTILMGASLGTGVASRMATLMRPSAVVLVSPFTSLPDVGAAKFPWAPVRLLMRDKLDSLKAMPAIKAPILVLHARDDRVIPFSQGEALAKAATGAAFVPFAQHGHQLQFTRQAQEAIVAWLGQKAVQTR